MGLRDLPIDIHPLGDDIIETYVKERDAAVESVEALQAFTERWRPLYELRITDEKPPPMDDPVIAETYKNRLKLERGEYDPEEVLKCLKVLIARDNCEHTLGEQGSCVAMHIALPAIMIPVMQVAQHYGAPPNLALIQLCGGYGALYEGE